MNEAMKATMHDLAHDRNLVKPITQREFRELHAAGLKWLGAGEDPDTGCHFTRYQAPPMNRWGSFEWRVFEAETVAGQDYAWNVIDDNGLQLICKYTQAEITEVCSRRAQAAVRRMINEAGGFQAVRTGPILPSPRPQPKPLRSTWCDCQDKQAAWDAPSAYMPDNMCPCGVGKHHYHCSICHGILQIG